MGVEGDETSGIFHKVIKKAIFRNYLAKVLEFALNIFRYLCFRIGNCQVNDVKSFYKPQRFCCLSVLLFLTVSKGDGLIILLHLHPRPRPWQFFGPPLTVPKIGQNLGNVGIQVSYNKK